MFTTLLLLHWCIKQSLLKAWVHMCLPSCEPVNILGTESMSRHFVMLNACHLARAQETLTECNWFTTWKEHTFRGLPSICKILLQGQIIKSVFLFCFVWFVLFCFVLKQRPQTTSEAKKKMRLEGNKSVPLILRWVWKNYKIQLPPDHFFLIKSYPDSSRALNFLVRSTKSNQYLSPLILRPHSWS